MPKLFALERTMTFGDHNMTIEKFVEDRVHEYYWKEDTKKHRGRFSVSQLFFDIIECFINYLIPTGVSYAQDGPHQKQYGYLSHSKC